MTNGEYLRQSDEHLVWFINLVTFYCSSRFVEHKSCSEVHCPLAKEGCTSCYPDNIMEWLKKEG